MKPVIEAINLCKSYPDLDNVKLDVLVGVNFTINQGDMIAIVGASGSGKTTLLQLLGGLDTPTSGEVRLQGRNIALENDKQRSQQRNQSLGFVYQFHHLLPELTALENVAMPLYIAGLKPKEAQQRAKDMLNEVGLAERANHPPAKLSGGERQRVAVARSMVNHPICLLADEPTGNLDQKSAHQTIDLIKHLNQQFGMSVIINTHDLNLAKKMNQIYTIQQGTLHKTQ